MMYKGLVYSRHWTGSRLSWSGPGEAYRQWQCIYASSSHTALCIYSERGKRLQCHILVNNSTKNTTAAVQNTYLTVDDFHFSCEIHVWRVSFWSVVSPLLSRQVCVNVLLRYTDAKERCSVEQDHLALNKWLASCMDANLLCSWAAGPTWLSGGRLRWLGWWL